MLIPRIITGLLLVALAIALLFYATPQIWLLAVMAFVAVAGWEWSQFFGANSWLQKLIYSLAGLVLTYASLQLAADQLLKIILVLQLAIALLAVFAYQKSQGRAQIKAGLAVIYGLIFIVAFGWSMVLLRDLLANAWLMLFSLSVVWMMDTGAYFAGRAFGKHKLANHVSPGKTWEGVIGGLLLVGLATVLVGTFADLPQLNQQQPGLVILVLALMLIAGLSVFGDLFESLLKRQAGIKDSGNIFPGHGGMLDRIDSLLIATPLLWLFWSWWLA